MTEDEKKELEPQNYLDVIKKLKEENEATKKRLAQQEQDNVNLINGILGNSPSGTTDDPKDTKEEEPQIVIRTDKEMEEMRKDLFEKEHTNLDTWKKTLAYRQAKIDRGEPDPFKSKGHNLVPYEFEDQEIEKVVDVVQDCIDNCQNDSNVFTSLLMSRTNDISGTLGRKK